MVSERMSWTFLEMVWISHRRHTFLISPVDRRGLVETCSHSAGKLAALWPWLWPLGSGSSAVSMAAEALEEDESLADSPQALCTDHSQRLTSLRAFSHRERTFVGEFSLQTRFWKDILGFYSTSCTNIRLSSKKFLAQWDMSFWSIWISCMLCKPGLFSKFANVQYKAVIFENYNSCKNIFIKQGAIQLKVTVKTL